MQQQQYTPNMNSNNASVSVYMAQPVSNIQTMEHTMDIMETQKSPQDETSGGLDIVFNTGVSMIDAKSN